MATRQPLRGGSDKLYDVITNFNRGIDKKVADDISLDTSFKELQNFYNANEGYLSKRPGVYNSNLFEFINKICESDYDTTKFRVGDNRFGESSVAVLARLSDFNNTIIKGITKQGTVFNFEADKIVGLQLYKNILFMEAMQDYENILNGNFSEIAGGSILEIGLILIASGYYTKTDDTNRKSGVYASRINIKLEHNSDGYYDAFIECDSVDSTMNPYQEGDSYKARWDFKPDNYVEGEEQAKPAQTVDISNYNGISYIAMGTNYIMKIDQNPDTKEVNNTYTGESNIITMIGGYGSDEETLYKPTAIEVQQVGFNILSKNPLEFIDRTGTVSKVKGVFYSVNISKADGTSFKQPILRVPYNSEFFIHVLYTGTNTPDNIKYREDNGETDIEKNPYIDLPGEWEDDEKTIWKCPGIDSDRKFELYIKLDTDEFRTYIETASVTTDETGYVDTISKLIFSSTHSKVINNQLVLYGGHGYVFFSEFDRFDYFPNYYFIYISSEAGEEDVTNISYFRQYYAIFTNKRIKRMTGTFGSDDFGIYPLSDFIGCPNGRTVRMVGNNLLFLGNDGIYKLKQGYLGEGTENVEKIDEALNGMLNLNNVLQAFTMNNNYIVVKNDGSTWIVYNTQTEAFYEYNLENEEGIVYNKGSKDEEFALKAIPFYSIFKSTLYDANGDFMLVPMYKYSYNEEFTEVTKNGCSLMLFRFNELAFLEENKQHKDGYGFISNLETHFMNMGYPTHTKKFKSIFIKMINKSGSAIPLYITVIIDDSVIMSPSSYVIEYDEEHDIYYYVERVESNGELKTGKNLGEFILGEDVLGNKTLQQIKLHIGEKGRAIKLILSDGFNDYTHMLVGDQNKDIPIRNRNIHNFSLSTIGIVYKLKKVKEG